MVDLYIFKKPLDLAQRDIGERRREEKERQRQRERQREIECVSV